MNIRDELNALDENEILYYNDDMYGNCEYFTTAGKALRDLDELFQQDITDFSENDYYTADYNPFTPLDELKEYDLEYLERDEQRRLTPGWTEEIEDILQKMFIEKNKLRELQDRFLDHPIVTKWVDTHDSETKLFFKYPSANDLSAEVYPEYANEIENLLNKWENQE